MVNVFDLVLVAYPAQLVGAYWVFAAGRAWAGDSVPRLRGRVWVMAAVTTVVTVTNVLLILRTSWSGLIAWMIAGLAVASMLSLLGIAVHEERRARVRAILAPEPLPVLDFRRVAAEPREPARALPRPFERELPRSWAPKMPERALAGKRPGGPFARDEEARSFADRGARSKR